MDYKKIGIKGAGVALGTVGGGMVLNMLPVSINDMWKGLIAIGAGLILPSFVKGDFVEAVGSGLVSVGTIKLAKEFKLNIGIAGIGEVEYSQEARNQAIEGANQQIAEYVAVANELHQEVNGLQEDGYMVARPEDENMVAEDLQYSM